MIERTKHPQKLADKLISPDVVDLSFLVLFDGWVEDVVRFNRSLTQVSGRWELVVVDNPVDDAASETIAGLDGVVHVPLRDRVGFGAGRNLALRSASGRIVVIVDTSVELTGDIMTALDSHLVDPAIGLVGRWGVSTSNGFDFVESDGPDVEGVEGYLMAMRREDVQRIGMFDPKFRFYRNADIDYSYLVRAAGLRTIVDTDLPVVRHEHRLWESTPDRDELSRKNFFRFRNRWY